MSDQQFEKQVRQKLDELKLTPSANAWDNIEAGLKSYRRRRAPLWVPLVLIGLGAGGYVMFKPLFGPKNTAALTTVAPSSSAKGSESGATVQPVPIPGSESDTGSSHNVPQKDMSPVAGALHSEPEKASVAETPSASSRPKSADKKRSAGAERSAVRKPKGDLPGITQPGIEPGQAASGVIINASDPGTRLPLKAESVHVEKDKKEFPTGLTHENEAAIAPGGEDLAGRIPNSKALPSTAYQDIKSFPLSVATAAEKKHSPAGNFSPDERHTSIPAALAASPQVLPKYNKWSFAVTASTGVSTVIDGRLLDFTKKAQVEDLAVLPAFAAGSVLQPAVPPANPPSADQPLGVRYLAPSKISAAMTYSIGAAVKRGISKRISLSAGLNYLQINTRSHVGQQVNASQVVNTARGFLAVTSYFRIEERQQATEYRNRYHFIELPVALHTRLNKNPNLPIYWNAGLAVGGLLNSNSLHYDGSTGVYYNDDKLLNRIQTSVNSGFSVALFNKKRFPLWVGPSARYNISKVLREKESTRQHFASVGLDVKLFLK